MGDPELEDVEWGYRGNLGHVTPCRDEYMAGREAALIHGEVMRREVQAGKWEPVG